MGRSDQRTAGEASRLIYEAVTVEAGDFFEGYCAEWVSDELKVRVTRHVGKVAQRQHGDLKIHTDPPENAEVKFDRQMRYSGNVMIEVDERRTQSEFVASGAYAESDAIWYLVGDCSRLFVFERTTLIDCIHGRELVSIKRPDGSISGHGVLLTIEEAERIKVVRFDRHGVTWDGAVRSIE